jgi:aldose 1-epimerase
MVTNQIYWNKSLLILKKIGNHKQNIPTGKFLNNIDSPFDFTNPKKNVLLKLNLRFDNKDEFAASLNKKEYIKMTVYMNQPGVHIYVGELLK